MTQFRNLLNTNIKYRDSTIHLKPSEIHVAKTPTLIWTTLGSCISIIFYHPQRQISSICHPQLPSRRKEPEYCCDHCPVKCLQDVDPANEFKYVTCTVFYMIRKFHNIGISKNDIQVKLFGGAKILKESSDITSVGPKNVVIAKQLLNDNGLKIMGENTGGNFGRTIYLYSDTGVVLHKKLPKSQVYQQGL